MIGSLDTFISEIYPGPQACQPDRLAACRSFWRSVARPQRVPLLLAILSRYRTMRQGSALNTSHELRQSYALNERNVTGYKSRIQPTEEEAFAILRTAYHTCAHGNDVRPPLDSKDRGR